LDIRENVILAPHTSFGIGGPARYFAEARSREELREALLFAREGELPCCFLGGGTNVLVSDRGFPGVVIKILFRKIEVTGNAILADAGADLLAMVNAASAHGLSGIEALAGIPGSVGGALRGNAGAYGTAIGDVVAEVEVLDAASLEYRRYRREACGFDYRGSLFKGRGDLVVVSARLPLSIDRPETVREKTEAILKSRGVVHEKCAGSFFLNAEVSDELLVKRFEAERKVVCRGCKIPAGWLIEQAGLRGEQLGGAKVSERHANYIINTGSATAEDVRRLAWLVKERVRERLGVELREEVSHVGF
jgi:UDP-N-acetylmuramate dehydrogenase